MPLEKQIPLGSALPPVEDPEKQEGGRMLEGTPRSSSLLGRRRLRGRVTTDGRECGGGDPKLRILEDSRSPSDTPLLTGCSSSDPGGNGLEMELLPADSQGSSWNRVCWAALVKFLFLR